MKRIPLMKVCIFLFNLSLVFTLEIQAQRTIPVKSVSYKTAYKQKSNEHLFTMLPFLKKIVIKYEEETPASVYIFASADSSTAKIIETYDLGFLGDNVIFQTKYGHNIIPYFPNAKVKSIPKLPEPNCKEVWIDKSVIIIKDSIEYELKIDCFTDKEGINYRKPYIGSPAHYSGDLRSLAKKIENSYKAGVNRKKLMDSVFVFRGIVKTDNTLSDVELILGKKSNFSWAVQRVLSESQNKWTPAQIGGVILETSCRFYARLNTNGSVTLLTPRRLLNAAGW